MFMTTGSRTPRAGSGTRSRRAAATAAAAALALLLSGCAGGGNAGDDATVDATPEATVVAPAEAITVWVQEDLPDRVAKTQAIIDDFTAASGIEVQLVPVAEDQFNQVLISSAAAGDLPDVIGAISLPQVRTLFASDLLDTETTAAILEALDPATFGESGLTLTREGDTQLAIPSESWTQLLLYRTDLFEAAGLAAPDSYENILAAAQALDSPEIAGFVGANVAGDAFTAQTFEHLALGNGCELVDEAGEVTLDSPECVEALQFYGDLIANFSVSGGQDVDTTRASYFAGQAAMTIWSTFILDELAGLREDAKPNCPECVDDPAFLSANTGVVTAISGPSGSTPAVFGEITSWAVPVDAATAEAQQFIEFMMGDGYEPWIAIAPEGKVPVRAGDADNATRFADAWANLEVGVDSKAPLADFYGEEVLDALTSGPTQLARWAIPQGQGDLLGAIQGEQPVARAVNEVTSGSDAETAATLAAESVRSIQSSLS